MCVLGNVNLEVHYTSAKFTRPSVSLRPKIRAVGDELSTDSNVDHDSLTLSVTLRHFKALPFFIGFYFDLSKLLSVDKKIVHSSASVG